MARSTISTGSRIGRSRSAAPTPTAHRRRSSPIRYATSSSASHRAAARSWAPSGFALVRNRTSRARSSPRGSVEIGARATERIIVPAHAARALCTRSLLGNDRVIGSLAPDRRDDRRFGPFVRLRNEIGRARLRTDARCGRAPKLEEQRAGLSCRLDRESARLRRPVDVHARRAPGFPSSTTNVAVVLTVAEGFLTVETARKSAMSLVGSRAQRTYPRWLSKNRSCGFLEGGVNCVCSTKGSPSELIEVPSNSVPIVGAAGSAKSRFRSYTKLTWLSPERTTGFFVVVNRSRIICRSTTYPIQLSTPSKTCFPSSGLESCWAKRTDCATKFHGVTESPRPFSSQAR